MVMEFLPEATEEAAEAVSSYEASEPGLGVRFRAELESASAAIVQQPLLWRERHGLYRRANLPGFPYYVAHCVRGQRLLIAAVAHTSRPPGYWKKRLP